MKRAGKLIERELRDAVEARRLLDEDDARPPQRSKPRGFVASSATKTLCGATIAVQLAGKST